MRLHPCLKGRYCQIISLRNYLVHLGAPSSDLKACNILLDTVTIAVAHDGELYPQSSPKTSEFDTLYFIHKAIECMVRSNAPNVLSHGYSVIRENSRNDAISETGCIRLNSLPNTVVVYLCTEVWRCLHRIIGDTAFYHLLVHTSMFVVLPQKNYVQVCGKPFHTVKESTCGASCARSKIVTMKDISFLDDLNSYNALDATALSTSSTRDAAVLASLQDLTGDSESLLTDCDVQPKRKRRKKEGSALQQVVKKQRKIKLNIPLSDEKIVYLKRWKHLYSASSLCRISKNFVLNNVTPSDVGINKLLNSVFLISTEEDSSQLNFLKSRKPFRQLIANFLALKPKLKHLLNFYCANPAWLKGKGCVSFEEAVESHLAAAKVFLFVRRIMKDVVPASLLGDPSNTNKCMKCVKEFLMMRRYEKMTVQHVLSKLDKGNVSWLRQDLEDSQKIFLYQQLILWIFNSFVGSIIRGYFYATETGWTAHRVVYYRKKVWMRICSIGLQPLIGEMYSVLTDDEVNTHAKSKNFLGVYPIRLIPSKTKLRPIAVMHKSYIPGQKKRFSLNAKLEDLHSVLQYESWSDRSLVGVSVRDKTNLYQRWREFVKSVRSEGNNFYFVGIDVSRCFDTLSQQHMLEIVPPVLKKDLYQVRRFISYNCNSRTKRYLRLSSDGLECDNFVSFLITSISTGRLNVSNSVLVYTYEKCVKKDALLTLFNEHISNSVGSINHQYVLLKTGLTQGSILASLCNDLYYGDMELTSLREFHENPISSILLRWVDDYICVSTKEDNIYRFVISAHNCLVGLNCSLNLSKSLANFELSVGGAKLPRCDGEWFPWCGYLVNTTTLNISYNYGGLTLDSLRNRLSVSYSAQSEHSIIKKFLHAVSMKATCLIVGREINSEYTVMKNIYQVFLHVAAKIYLFMSASVKQNTLAIDSLFLVSLIEKLPKRFIKSCRKNFGKQVCLRNPLNLFSVPRASVQWLCYQAFVDTLRKKKQYDGVTSVLVQELKRMVSIDVDINRIRTDSNLYQIMI